MNKILSFDSIYLAGPIRFLYLKKLAKMLRGGGSSPVRVFICRLDKNNIFLCDERNVSGTSTCVRQERIDALSMLFYRSFAESGLVDKPSINDVPLHRIYPRQVKLKLASVLSCALKLIKINEGFDSKLEVATDRQTAEIMMKALRFLNFDPRDIDWKISQSLSFLVTLNSLLMTTAAVAKSYVAPSKLPAEYYRRIVNPALPTVMYVLPHVRPEDLMRTYVAELEQGFNTILYSMGEIKKTPSGYEKLATGRSKSILKGLLRRKGGFYTAQSYFTDIMLIYSKHADLLHSVNVCNSVFSNRIDAYVCKQQTNALETYLSVEAKDRGVFVLADIMEEVFYCDAAICASENDRNASLELAVADGGGVAVKGGNSLIEYRMQNAIKFHESYIHKLLEIDLAKKILFYASDPSKEESHRFITEKFLMQQVSSVENCVLVIKTHPEDRGRVTNSAYLTAGKPLNVRLVGDLTRRSKMVSGNFQIFNDFDFHSAISSSDGFLTLSSSAILEAIALGVKTGVVDLFGKGFYDYLVVNRVSSLIKDQSSLQSFLEAENSPVPADALHRCGLLSAKTNFDLCAHLLAYLDARSDLNRDNMLPIIGAETNL